MKPSIEPNIKPSFLWIIGENNNISKNKMTKKDLEFLLKDWFWVNHKGLNLKLISAEEFNKKLENTEPLVEREEENWKGKWEEKITVYFPDDNTIKVYPLLEEIRRLTKREEKTKTRLKEESDKKYIFIKKVAQYLEELKKDENFKELFEENSKKNREEKTEENKLKLTEEEKNNYDILVNFFNAIGIKNEEKPEEKLAELTKEEREEIEKYLLGEKRFERIEKIEDEKDKIKWKKKKLKIRMQVLTKGNKKLDQKEIEEETWTKLKKTLLTKVTQKHQESLENIQSMGFEEFFRVIHDLGIMNTANKLTLGKIKEGLDSEDNRDNQKEKRKKRKTIKVFINTYWEDTTLQEVVKDIMTNWSELYEKIKKIINLISSIGFSYNQGKPADTLRYWLQQCVMATSFLKTLEDYDVNYLPINIEEHVCSLIEIKGKVYRCDPIKNYLKEFTNEHIGNSDISIEEIKKYLRGELTKPRIFRVQSEYFRNMYSYTKNTNIQLWDKKKLLSWNLQSNLWRIYSDEYKRIKDRRYLKLTEKDLKLAEKYFKLAEKYFRSSIENYEIEGYFGLWVLFSDKYKKTENNIYFTLAIQEYENFLARNSNMEVYFNLWNLYSEKYQETRDKKYLQLAIKNYEGFIECEESANYPSQRNYVLEFIKECKEK